MPLHLRAGRRSYEIEVAPPTDDKLGIVDERVGRRTQAGASVLSNPDDGQPAVAHGMGLA
jgi:hypothetical protein